MVYRLGVSSTQVDLSLLPSAAVCTVINHVPLHSSARHHYIPTTVSESLFLSLPLFPQLLFFFFFPIYLSIYLYATCFFYRILSENQLLPRGPCPLTKLCWTNEKGNKVRKERRYYIESDYSYVFDLA